MLFSHTGNTITDQRTCLDADKVNNLLFIKRNIRTLKEIYPPALEHVTKRKNDLISIDSTSSTTPNKKIKLMTRAQEVNGTITDEDSENEEL